MGEWRYVTLEKVIEKFIDYRGKSPDKKDSGVPLITAKIVKSGHLTTPTEFIAEKDYDEWMTRGFPQKNDVVLTTEAPLGEVALIKDQHVALAQRIIVLHPNSKICDGVFLKYYFQSAEGQNSLVSRASGTTVEGIKAAELKKVDIPLPPLPEQRAIAGVLGSLDDKIDLLCRQNKTLDALAEALFRQWFIEEADERWTEGTIADYAIHFKESVRPQEKPDTLFYHYSIPAFDAAEWPSSEYGEAIQSNKYKVVRGSVLFSKLNPHRDKRIWMIPNEIDISSICSTEFQVIQPQKTEYMFFIYCWLSLKENYNEIASGVGGTSGSHQRIDPQSIFSYRCPIVPLKRIENLNKRVSPLFEKKNQNQLQIRTLIALRDTLLPKLMSGEVRVEVDNEE